MSKGGGKHSQRKKDYFKRLESYLTDYSKILVVTANNVGSNQLQKMRTDLRGTAVILMGKNTMVRKCMREHLAKNPSLEPLLNHIKGNIGFIFTNGDLAEIRNKLVSSKVRAAAKAGAIAPVDVIVPAGPTTLEPTKTSFFQALQIPTKINKGTIEIINDVHLIKAGNKVGASQAVLLQMLGIQPFQYSLNVKMVFDDGSVYPPSLLDLTDADVLARFRKGVTNVAALSVRIGYPTIASVPYVLTNGFRDLVSVSLATQFTFPAAQKIKELLENPEAFAAASKAAQASSSGSSSSGGATEKAPEKETKEADKEDEQEEEGAGLDAGGLFGGDDDDY